MLMARYSKAFAAGIPAVILVLNQVLPVTSGDTKLVVNAVLAVLAVVAVVLAPANATPTARPPRLPFTP
jgi:hypothetical protein